MSKEKVSRQTNARMLNVLAAKQLLPWKNGNALAAWAHSDSAVKPRILLERTPLLPILGDQLSDSTVGLSAMH